MSSRSGGAQLAGLKLYGRMPPLMRQRFVRAVKPSFTVGTMSVVTKPDGAIVLGDGGTGSSIEKEVLKGLDLAATPPELLAKQSAGTQLKLARTLLRVLAGRLAFANARLARSG